MGTGRVWPASDFASSAITGNYRMHFAAAHGALYTGSGDLASLTGHPATTLSAAVGAALRVLGTGIGRH